MAGNTFGQLFTVTSFGESHGPALGCVVDGCPPGLALSEADIQADVERRRPGTSQYTTQRRETRHGAHSFRRVRRPHDGHADRPAGRERGPALEGLREDQGPVPPGPRGLHLSAKIRLSRLSRRRPLLRARDRHAGGGRRHRPQVSCASAGECRFTGISLRWDRWCSSREDPASAYDNPFFCPDPARIAELEEFIWRMREAGDSIGARITVVARGVPPGWGEPVFARLDADLASAMMGINAVKGVEIGDGFRVRRAEGSEHRDELTPDGIQEQSCGRRARRHFLRSGYLVSIALKPTSSINVPGDTIDVAGRAVRDRHHRPP